MHETVTEVVSGGEDARVIADLTLVIHDPTLVIADLTVEVRGPHACDRRSHGRDVACQR